MPSVEVVCERVVAATAEQTFALALDTQAFPALFQGYGLVPAVTRVERLDDGPLRVGSRRRVESADGNSIEETVLELDPPRRHRYGVSGFAAPFDWWVARAEADWRWSAHGEGVRVSWQYRFVTRGPLSRLIVGIVARRFFLPAMRQCLDALADCAERQTRYLQAQRAQAVTAADEAPPAVHPEDSPRA